MTVTDDTLEPRLEHSTFDTLAPLPVFHAPDAIASSVAQGRAQAEEALYERFRRQQPERPLVFEFTRDKALLHQYFYLRENIFIKVWGLEHFHGQQDEFDNHAHILVVRDGRQCVGGVRLVAKTPRSRHSLPMEDDSFRLETLLPELAGGQGRYAEMSRLALLPDVRDGGRCSTHVFRRIYRKGVALNLDYIFAIAPYEQSRVYRRICRGLGIDFVRRDDITVPDRPEYEGIRMCLMMCTVQKETLENMPESDEESVSEFA